LKLLLDENVSFRMLAELRAGFPGSSQVTKLGLETADDKTLWSYARKNGFTLVTQDSDFHELATLYGPPPKVIWLKCGNRPRWFVSSLLLRHRDEIIAFGDDPETDVVEISE
jgi:predicted nuclease of predicted toxin-antitoxin system